MELALRVVYSVSQLAVASKQCMTESSAIHIWCLASAMYILAVYIASYNGLNQAGLLVVRFCHIIAWCRAQPVQKGSTITATMENQGFSQPLVLQPTQGPYSVPPLYHYQPIDQTEETMLEYGTPLLHQPTAGHQGRDPLHHQSAMSCAYQNSDKESVECLGCLSKGM